MTIREKVLDGLETLSRHAGNEFSILVEKSSGGQWMVRFRSGTARVQMTLEDFIKSPQSVLDSFTEEIIRRG